ncbi:hypothetical protein EU642_21770 [Salmonella enterica]|nr:hypothetical protein [Salmonella enterica]EAO0118482.1 hypothetical protein [Salmonella enterica]EAO3601702.1 hypothetical protein [Salmonella enterica]EAR6391599.1 hypothetical protein [Salmonella enterica]EAV1285244.1 hypothetical protein [Salmonella enterica]
MNFDEAKTFLRQIDRWPTPDMCLNHINHLYPLPEGWKWFEMVGEWRVAANLDNGTEWFWYRKVWANPPKMSDEAKAMIERLARGEPL